MAISRRKGTRRIWRESGIEADEREGGKKGGCGEGKVVDGGDEWVGSDARFSEG